MLGLDYSDFSGFDPQALTSLTKAALSGPEKAVGFDPQALTSLTISGSGQPCSVSLFRSTGSYEPDRECSNKRLHYRSFDPQALTSLTIRH